MLEGMLSILCMLAESVLRHVNRSWTDPTGSRSLSIRWCSRMQDTLAAGSGGSVVPRLAAQTSAQKAHQVVSPERFPMQMRASLKMKGIDAIVRQRGRGGEQAATSPALLPRFPGPITAFIAVRDRLTTERTRVPRP